MLLGCHSVYILLQSLPRIIYYPNSIIIRKNVVVSIFYLRDQWVYERVRSSFRSTLAPSDPQDSRSPKFKVGPPAVQQ